VLNSLALYLSDVLATSYNAVKDTAVYPGDQVAIFGAGPIGQMAGIYAIGDGAKTIIFVDTEPRLSFVSARWPIDHKDKLRLLDYKKLSFGITNKETVVSKLKEICDGRGPDVAIECAAGEYAKGWLHWLELSLGAETDTSEILNEMIEGVRNYGRAGITGVYVGYVSDQSKQLNCTSKSANGHELDKSFEYRLCDAARHPAYWEWPSTCTQILGRVAGYDSKWKIGSYPNDFS
jgi:threonine dehydrogenase-like Zn-dependent dehydrogenase